jgi:hypothetical protein
MISKDDILPLIKQYNLLTIELDDRHMAIINEVFALGISAGVNHAKDCISWRINGPMWAEFIDKGVIDADA